LNQRTWIKGLGNFASRESDILTEEGRLIFPPTPSPILSPYNLSHETIPCHKYNVTMTKKSLRIVSCETLDTRISV